MQHPQQPRPTQHPQQQHQIQLLQQQQPSSVQPAIAPVIVSINQRRLPVPFPVPCNCFSANVIQAIDNNNIKGTVKITLIRQVISFYYGICPRPRHDEYTCMAKTLCNKYGQLKDKKPNNNPAKKFVYYVSQLYYDGHYYNLHHNIICSPGYFQEENIS